MNAPDIITFLGLIGCRKIRPFARGVRATCPFESQHVGGQDEHPSFAIMLPVGGEGESTFKCHGCNQGGDLGRMLKLMDANRPMQGGMFAEKAGFKDRAGELYRFIITKDRMSAAAVEAQDPDSIAAIRARISAATWQDQIYLSRGDAPAPARVQPPPPMDESFLDDFFIDPIGKGLKYLTKRGYREETIRAWEIKWHPKQNRVAIPIRDKKGRLVGISGRTIDPKGRPKYLHSTGFKRDFYLFGEWKLIEGTGIIVEGQFDVIGLWQDGFRNGVGVFGSSITAFQLEKIVDYFSDVVILTDGDKPGREAAEKWCKQLDGLIPFRVPAMPTGKDPDNLSQREKIDILGTPQVVDNRFSLCDRETL